MSVITVFLCDSYISDFRPVFVSARQRDSDIWKAMGFVFDAQLDIRSVLLRYYVSWLIGGC